jgi:hypothetical protein
LTICTSRLINIPASYKEASGGNILAQMKVERPPKNVIEDLKKTSTATVYTALWNLGFKLAWMQGIIPLIEGVKIVGPAVTLRYISYREDKVPPAGLASLPNHRPVPRHSVAQDRGHHGG